MIKLHLKVPSYEQVLCTELVLKLNAKSYIKMREVNLESSDHTAYDTNTLCVSTNMSFYKQL